MKEQFFFSVEFKSIKCDISLTGLWPLERVAFTEILAFSLDSFLNGRLENATI
jgi:hypothetical protein